ncbi:unnamed protein product [Leptosia nina]|uniref:trypsin n=1 Tax=Leptosia nina TaxID=320188 RepID=A0AAV1JF80_9NEOP
MFYVSIYILVFVIYSSAESLFSLLPEGDDKILGGTDAPDGSIKYQVSLQNLGSHFCGASVIDKKWVITAAHCTTGRAADSFKVVVGINLLNAGGQKYVPDKVIIHPDFDKKLVTNDISLIKINKGIEFNKRVQPIALPTEETQAGDTLTVSGWGRTENGGIIPNKLQVVNVTATTLLECQLKYALFKTPVRESNLCTEAPPHEGSCQGDSGGPLVNKETLAGLVSWGTSECGDSMKNPDVNTNVFYYKEWIKETMEENE